MATATAAPGIDSTRRESFAKDIHLSTSMIDGIRVINVGKEIDVYTVHGFYTLAMDQIEEHDGRIVVDLSNADNIDVAGISTLISLYKHIKERNGELRLVLSPRIKKVFEITNLRKIFVDLPDADQAAADIRMSA